MNYFILLQIYLSLFCISYQSIVYFEFQFNCLSNTINKIKYSEGEISPLNPAQNPNLDYTLYFSHIKHKLNESLCINVEKNNLNKGSFAFKKAFLNEYDISELDFANFWECPNCSPTNYIYNENCYQKQKISLSYNNDNSINEFCLLPTTDISIFNQGNENKINNNFYVGKQNINLIINYKKAKFTINELFYINGYSNYVFDLDNVSLKIIDVINFNSILSNEDEELFVNSTFNAKSNYMSHEKKIEEGYLMIITIITVTRTNSFDSTSYTTCSKPSILNVYVSQDNCTMSEFSDDFCQKCKKNYVRYGDKCLLKTDKIKNLYYNESSQAWEICENSKDNFICSICPKGTYIKEKKETYQICEKCPNGAYSDEEDLDNCKECLEGYDSFYGSEKCFMVCNKGSFLNGDICLECEPGFYYDSLSDACVECSPGTFTSKSGMGECLACEPGTFNNNYKQTGCIVCPSGYYSSENSKECLKCPIGTFNPYMKAEYCQKCDYGYYNDEEGAEKCKICPTNFYSDIIGSNSCKECKENTHSFSGAKKCLSCNKLISNCNNCSKEGFCLECGNHALNGNDNCEICEDNWRYEGESCKPNKCKNYYYINENTKEIICINNYTECPQNKIYLNLETKECEQNIDMKRMLLREYQINGNNEILNIISDEIFEEFKKFPYLIDEILENGNITLNGIDSIYQIGMISENNIPNNKSKTISKYPSLDFGNCPSILRTEFEIKNSEKILYKILFDVNNYGDASRAYLYRETDLGNPLDLEPCEGMNITYISPSSNYYEYFGYYKKGNIYLNIFNKANQIFDVYSQVYKPCYPLSILGKIDLTIRDRWGEFERKKLILCNEGCKFEGLDIETFQVRCFCPIIINKENITKSKFIQGIQDFGKWNNFEVLKCYELLFSVEGQNNNYISEILLLIIIICIICSIMTEIYKSKFRTLIIYCRDFINNEFKNNSNFNIIKSLQKKVKTKEVLDKNEKQLLQEIEKFERDKNYSYIKIISNPPYNKNNTYNNTIRNKKTFKEEKRNKSINVQMNNGMIIINSNKDIENLSINKINNNKENKENAKYLSVEEFKVFKNFYNCLIISIEKDKCQNYLIENELDELDYYYYRLIENRKWYEIIWSHIKLNSDLLSTFLNYNSKKDYRIYTIKTIIYFNSIFISLFVNICFYHDDTMHKIYEENGNYNFGYKFPYIAFADIVSTIGYCLFEKILLNFQDNLIKLKTEMDEIERNRIAINIEKKFKIKRIFFYIISFLLQVFIWYFISCFFALYQNTQIQLLIDFCIGLIFNIGKLLIKTIFNLSFKCCAIKCKSNSKILNYIFNIMNIKFFNILFECLIELPFIFLFKL